MGDSDFFNVYLLIIKSTDFYSYLLDSKYQTFQTNTVIETYNIAILVILTIMILLVVFKLLIIFVYFFVYGVVLGIWNIVIFLWKNKCTCVQNAEYIVTKNYVIRLFKKIYT